MPDVSIAAVVVGGAECELVDVKREKDKKLLFSSNSTLIVFRDAEDDTICDKHDEALTVVVAVPATVGLQDGVRDDDSDDDDDVGGKARKLDNDDESFLGL